MSKQHVKPSGRVPNRLLKARCRVRVCFSYCPILHGFAWSYKSSVLHVAYLSVGVGSRSVACSSQSGEKHKFKHVVQVPAELR